MVLLVCWNIKLKFCSTYLADIELFSDRIIKIFKQLVQNLFAKDLCIVPFQKSIINVNFLFHISVIVSVGLVIIFTISTILVRKETIDHHCSNIGKSSFVEGASVRNVIKLKQWVSRYTLNKRDTILMKTLAHIVNIGWKQSSGVIQHVSAPLSAFIVSTSNARYKRDTILMKTLAHIVNIGWKQSSGVIQHVSVPLSAFIVSTSNAHWIDICHFSVLNRRLIWEVHLTSVALQWLISAWCLDNPQEAGRRKFPIPVANISTFTTDKLLSLTFSFQAVSGKNGQRTT